MHPHPLLRSILFVVLLTSLVLAGCSAPAPAVQPQPTQAVAPTATALPPTPAPTPTTAPMVLTMALSREPKTLDPQLASSSAETSLLALFFDTLVYRTLDNQYKPLLAKDWAFFDDGLSATFHLREGVVFHDGTPLNADAVVFTFQRFTKVGSKRSPLAGELQNIASIEKVDDLTVTFHFTSPSATFLNAISQPYAGILSPTAVEKAGEAFGQHPIGTGPFTLAEWNAGQSLVLTPFDKFAWPPADVANPGRPYLDKLVLKIIPDSTAQVNALKAGEVDIAYVTSADAISELENDPNITLLDIPSNGLYYLAFNLQKPPLDQLKVRQALSHAINKAEIVSIAFHDLAKPVFTLLPPNVPGASPELEAYELKYDPAKARQLLAEAGLTVDADGQVLWQGQPLRLKLITYSSPLNSAIATLLESQLRAIGVGLDVQQMEVAGATEAANKGQHDLLLWRYDWTDPDALAMWFSSDRIGAGNRAFYRNPEVDALLKQGKMELDQSKRIPLYIEAQKRILQDAVWQPLATPLSKVAVRASIQNLHVVSLGRLLFNDVTIAGASAR